MRIGIDIRPLIFTRAGIRTYVCRLVERLSAQQGNRLFLFASAPSGIAWDNRAIEERTLRLPLLNRWCEGVWQEAMLPAGARREKLDVFHGPRFWVPLDPGCPSVVTVHDLAFKKMGGLMDPKAGAMFDRLVSRSLQRAARVIVPSEATRADLIRLYPVRPEQVRVVHEAADGMFAPGDRALAQERCRQRFGIDRPFFLFVGTLEPRKNLVRLLEAYACLRLRRADTMGREADLVIAGGTGWLYRDIFTAVRRLGLEGQVKFLGAVEPQDLCALYNACAVFVFPSLYEGFGLPVLEALACGAVTVTSANSSLQELFGDCTCQVDAASVESIAAGLQRAASDDGLRKILREKGLRRAGEFSWEKTAVRTLQVYAEAIGDVPQGATPGTRGGTLGNVPVLMIDAGGWGGITHYTYNLMQSLSREAGCACALLTDAAYELESLPRSFEVIKAGFNRRAYPAQVLALIRVILVRRPAVIHVQTLFSARKDWLLFLLARCLGIKVVLTAHNVMPHEEFEQRAFGMRRAMRMIYRCCRAIIVHSAFSRQELMRSFGVPASRIRVIAHGNYLFARPAQMSAGQARQQLGVPEGKFVFLHFGALRRYKGIDILLEAFKQVRSRNDRVFLILAGKPMHLDEEYLRRMIVDLGVEEDVLFKPGYVDLKDIPAYFFASDAAVFPYVRTDTSGALQLAYAFGKPVIATRVGGIPEDVENNGNGILVTPGDPVTLKLAMEVLASQPQSAQEMGRRSHALAQERFSWERIAAATGALYRECI